MKTIARVYESHAEARRVATDLRASGIAASDINVIANRYACEEHARLTEPSATGPGAGVGAALAGTAGLLSGLGLIAIPGLGPVVAAGPLAAAVAAAVAGATTGGLVGALVKGGRAEEDAQAHCAAVRSGGAMVSVRLANRQAHRVAQIMARSGPARRSSR